MEIFLTGGSGFVGRALSHELVQRGHRVRCLVRGNARTRLIDSPLILPVEGDIFAGKELIPLIQGADAVIHLVGIIREYPRRGITFERLHYSATAAVVAATQAAGIKRYLHMSANGSGSDARSKYHQTKWRAEEAVRSSDLNWTIFRPSLIFGTEDQFVNLITKLICRLPLVPIFGDGEYRLQPVSVGDVAKGFALALERPISHKKLYSCGGPECFSYNRLLDQIAEVLGKKRLLKIHQPLALMRPLISILQHLPYFPISSDQLEMLLEGNCCDPREWRDDLGIESTSFRKGIEYLKPE